MKADEALEHSLELVDAHVDVLDDAAVEHRGRDVAVASLALRLPKAHEDDALETGEAVAHVGQVILAAAGHRLSMRRGGASCQGTSGAR